jgi:flagellar biosynthesis/type III secretory pathway protein FliH
MLHFTRRFHQMQDILRETRAYQEIMQEGELRALRQAVLDIVQERFSEIISFARKQIDDIQDPEIMHRLIVKMSIARTPEEALQYLFTVDKGEKKN